MSEQEQWQHDFYQGLKSLAESAFPKHCNNCGRIYETAEDFINSTKNLPTNSSGLKQSIDDDESTIVELYRNCECGSTLLNFYRDRRDNSSQGLDRRKQFGELLIKLVELGLSEISAHIELIKVMRGESSEILKEIQRNFP